MLLGINTPLGKCSPSLLLRTQEPPFQEGVTRQGGLIDIETRIREGLIDLELCQLTLRKVIALMHPTKFAKLNLPWRSVG